MKTATLKPSTRFAVSLHPEIFYAMQVLCDDNSRIHRRWKSLAQKRLPKRWQGITIPARMWPAVADVLDIEPTVNFSTLISALEAVPARRLQERFLIGLLHSSKATNDLLDQGLELPQVVGTLPKAKREWLAHVGIYPMEPLAAVALKLVIANPQRFQTGVLQTLHSFWDTIFAETWQELQPALETSVAEKRQVFESCTFTEFMRHTLLPIECDEKKRVLRAIRGGAVTSMADITLCTFTPSVFNDARFWTTSASEPGALWFPYFEPDLAPHHDAPTAGFTEPAADIALIFRALGDATRFAIASLIGRQPRTAVELAAILSVSKPTISHHIHILRTAGLINETNHGGSVLISLRRSVLDQLSTLAVSKLLDTRGPVEFTTSRRQS